MELRTRKRVLWNVLIADIAVAFVAFVLWLFFQVSGSVSNVPDESWAKIENMPYKEAVEYIVAHSTETSGLGFLWGTLSWWSIVLYAKSFVWFILFAGVVSLVTMWRVGVASPVPPVTA